MFRIKASYKAALDINAPLARVREFFRDLKNFAEMLSGIESIRREEGGVARWTITADTPIGHVRFSFPVQQTIYRADLIEWSPAGDESGNLLRYSVGFAEREAGT